MTLYWAAEIVAVYAALRMFGVALNPARVVLAYGTGYVVTRRSLPLAGAAITEVLLTFALHWVGAPLAPALAAVVTYRLFNLILISVPSLLANQQLRPSLAADVKPLQRARALALSRNDCTSASPAAGVMVSPTKSKAGMYSCRRSTSAAVGPAAAAGQRHR